MAYEVVFRPRALRDLAALPEQDRRRVAEKIAGLAENPRPHGSEKLKGRAPPEYRIRVGDYRVVYEVDDKVRVVTILGIGQRGGIYK
jgi:mRNA interferase RelE/StbE